MIGAVIAGVVGFLAGIMFTLLLAGRMAKGAKVKRKPEPESQLRWASIERPADDYGDEYVNSDLWRFVGSQRGYA